MSESSKLRQDISAAPKSSAASEATPPKGMSPSTRQAAKEQAEAAALAEIESQLQARRARTAALRKLRLGQSKARSQRDK